MIKRVQIARNWLPRYTGMPLDKFGDYILLTNCQYYFDKFVEKTHSYIAKLCPIMAQAIEDGIDLQDAVDQAEVVPVL